MVLSIESSGIKEAVILRQRDDGEYQLLSGYRRRRASELVKKLDIPAHIYEMTMQEAIAYRKAVKNNPNASMGETLLQPAMRGVSPESIAWSTQREPPHRGGRVRSMEGKADPGCQNKQSREARETGTACMRRHQHV